MRHLTDDQLQDRLDRGTKLTDALGDGHLRSCHQCRERLSKYQRLCDGLRQDKGYELPAGFAETVMTRLAAAAPAPPVSRLWDSIWTGVGVAATLCLIAYFVNLGSVASIVLKPFAAVAPAYQSWLTAARDSLAAFSGYTGPLLIASVVLLTVRFADNLLLHLKGRTFSL